MFEFPIIRRSPMSPEPSTKKLTPSDIAHQEAIQKLKENGGLVAAHSLGSGKTLLSLRAARELGGKSLFITPASLVSNVHKEEDKHNIHTGAEVLSYEKAVNDADRLRKKDYNLVVFDEAQNREWGVREDLDDRLRDNGK